MCTKIYLKVGSKIYTYKIFTNKYTQVKEHEAPGGKFANGVIVRDYRPGEVITVTSHITANHVVSNTISGIIILYPVGGDH